MDQQTSRIAGTNRKPKAVAAQPAKDDEMALVVAGNLRRLRDRRNLSLESLAKLSGVSRAMLGQIEQGRSAPTIKILSRIAAAFDVPVSSFLAREEDLDAVVLRPDASKVLKSNDGGFASRALFPFRGERKVEFYEVTLDVSATEQADAHAPGTTENLVVSEGEIEISIDGKAHRLSTGDAIYFKADTPHVYRNLGANRAVLYLVMTYAESVTS